MLISFQGVTKRFPMVGGSKLLRSHVARALGGKRLEFFTALQDVSFEVDEGQSLALIGRNGAGKSTALCLAAGLAPPDEGTVSVSGQVAPLLELGSGFHPDLTGAENIEINAALLGWKKRDLDAAYDRIVEFSELSVFIDQPVRTYSSGMVMRLAFSVAVHLEPQVFIVDELLAVGDASFSQKCASRIMKLKQKGTSLLMASHSPDAVMAMCDRAIWLDGGRIVRHGKCREVVNAYLDSGRERAAAGA